MGSAKGIVYKNIAIGRQLSGHLFAVGINLAGLFFMEANVLQHRHSAFGQGIDGRFLAQRIRQERDAFAQLGGKVINHGLHAVLAIDEFLFISFGKFLSGFRGFFSSLLDVLVRVAEVAHQDEAAGALFQNVLDCGERRHDAGVVLHHAVLHGNVEVNAHDDALAFQVNVFYRLNHIFLQM